MSAIGGCHALSEIETDMDGWVWAFCDCGWTAGPFVGEEDAVDAYGDHRADVS